MEDVQERLPHLGCPLAPAQAPHGTDLVKPLALLVPLALAACGGGGGGGGGQPAVITAAGLPGAAAPAEEVPKAVALSKRDASRLLTQATFGIRSLDQVKQLSTDGAEAWLWRQFNAPVDLHTSYLDARRTKNEKTGELQEAGPELSFQAIWRQWLFDEPGQLRARVAFALSEIMVISDIAPDIRPYAMSSYMDMLNRNAFGNYRTLLKEVALHPAMGYYLNMLQSQKEDPEAGTHPNENFAREVLQLFSIGVVKLDSEGGIVTDDQGKPVSTYGQNEVKGLARAFSGWSFGGQSATGQQAMQDLFWGSDYNNDANWTQPMRAYPAFHEPGTKQLLDGVVLPAGQAPEKDMDDALDNIFHHPNVPFFICRQLIQRLVTSNPTKAYWLDVVAVFKDNGQGVRGDLRAVVHAILMHAHARGDDAASRPDYGKLREPIIRFASFLRALDAQPRDAVGSTDFWSLFNDEMPLGQHPFLAPSVFNFFSPSFRPAGAIAKHDLVAPEFQITNETTVVSTYNTFHDLMHGWEGQYNLTLDFASWQVLAVEPDKLADRLDVTLFCHQMTDVTRQRLVAMLQAMEKGDEWRDRLRVNAAFLLSAMSPDFVIQK